MYVTTRERGVHYSACVTLLLDTIPRILFIGKAAAEARSLVVDVLRFEDEY